MSFRLHLGDCVEFMRGLGDRSVDHVIADPPYGKRTHAGQRHGRRGERYKDGWVSSAGLSYDHLTEEDVVLLSKQYVRLARKWILLMTSHDLFPIWERALGRYSFAPVPIVLPGMNVRLAGDGPSSWSVWLVVNRPVGLKDGTKPGAYVGSPGAGVARADNPVKGAKPLWLMKAILNDYTQPGELILDSHAGSGTTGVACIELGRDFLGCEQDATHYQTAYERLTNTARQEVMFRAPMKQQTLTLVTT